MTDLPDEIMLKIFLNIPWKLRLELESVCKRWQTSLRDSKQVRYIGCIDLESLVVNSKWVIQLPQIVNSLLINRRKIIKEIILGEDTKIDHVMAIMSTVLLTQTDYLTHLRIGSRCRHVFNNINSLLHLRVLDLNYFNGSRYHQAIIDLSQLVQLKELMGEHVKYINCRSSCLAKLDYSNVTLNCLSDCTDFLQMLYKTQQGIEILVLRSVMLNSMEHSGQFANFKPPRLLELNVIDCSVPNGLTIDLVESTSLRVIKVHGSNCNYITHIDLSSLVRFEVRDDSFTDEFITSAMDKPACFCPLEELTVEPNNNHHFMQLLNCFSAFYNYSLCEFRVNRFNDINYVLQDSNALVIIVRQCPHLSILDFDCVDIDKDCLIHLIAATVPLNINTDIVFNKIVNGTLKAFVSDLFTSLSLIDNSIIYHSNVCVMLYHFYPSCTRVILENIRAEFGIAIRES